MQNKLTVIMYHYVRPLKGSRFPHIKGLELDLFTEQIRYLKKHYNVISMEHALESLQQNLPLPKNSALLTFDDAYLDHFLYAYPILKRFQMQGSFFAPVKAVTQGEVLDVNQIHFILASTIGKLPLLIADTESLFEKYKNDFEVNSFDFYYKKLAQPNRFDCKDTVFVKRLLQVELPEHLRSQITKSLFEKHIGLTQESFSKELYMNTDQIEHMVSDGMHFGSHGHNHYWWDKLTATQLETEVKQSTDFLINVGASKDHLTACYPYGAYNKAAIEKLKEYNYKAAFTSKVDIATLEKEQQFELPRLDTNDIPKQSNAIPNKWYNQL